MAEAVSGHGSASSGRLAAASLAPHNNFDLVRLAAAAQVAIYHTTLLLRLHLPGALRYILDAMPGVPLFFVTSGFLLAGSLERDSDLRRYARNRALRIYPGLWLCFVVTLIVLAVSGVLTGSLLLSLRGARWVVAQLLVASTTPAPIRRFGFHAAPNGALWTIGVEIGFYVVLGLLWWAFVRRVRRPVADVTIAVLAVVSFLIAVNSGTISAVAVSGSSKLLKASPIPYLWIFFLGVLARRRWDVVGPIVRGRAWLWLPVAVVGYHVLPGLRHPTHGIGWAGLAGDRVLLALAALSAAYSAPGLADRLLHGVDISYGLYLYHYVWIGAFFEAYQRRGSWAIGAAVLASAVGSALVSWFAVESRALRLKARAPSAVSRL